MNAQANEVAGAAQARKKTDKQIEKVRMADGREVEFVGKRRQLKEAEFNTETGEWKGVRFDFRNGGSLYFHAPHAHTKLKNGILALHQFAAHGALQKFGDETAGTDKLDDMVLDVEDLMDRVKEGEWSVEREGGGMAGTSILIRALVELTSSEGKPKTYEALKDWLKGKKKTEKDAMRVSPKLHPIVQRLEAEDAAKLAHVDTSVLFDELDTA
jgi:hypothetical protein